MIVFIVDQVHLNTLHTILEPNLTYLFDKISAGEKDSADLVAEAESYYLELDIKFKDVRNGRSRSIFLGFNYDELNANGHDTPLEVVALRFMRKKLCAQFLTVLDGMLALQAGSLNLFHSHSLLDHSGKNEYF